MGNSSSADRELLNTLPSSPSVPSVNGNPTTSPQLPASSTPTLSSASACHPPATSYHPVSSPSTNSTTRPSASGMDPSGRHPLTFHQVHGENVGLFNSGRTAKRIESFCKGLAFSARPIAVDETVCLKFSEVATNWSGVLRFGFTANDPATMLNNIPKYACPDLTNKPGNWAKALAERFCSKDNILHFFFRETGDVFYGINGVQKGLFMSGLTPNVPLWVVVDIYGNSTAVEFMDPADVPSLRRRHGPQMEHRSNSTNLPSATTRVQFSVSRPSLSERSTSVSDAAGGEHAHNLELEFNQRMNLAALSNESGPPTTRHHQGSGGLKYHSDLPFTPLELHAVHGKNIRLSPERTVATRLETEYTCGYVFTSRPIRLKEKVVIQIMSTQTAFVSGLAFGLTSCDPVHLSPESFPEDSDLLLDRQEYWVVQKDVGTTPKPGDELAFYVSDIGEVWFYKNRNAPRIIMHVDQSQALWMFFDVYGSSQKVKLCGTLPWDSMPAHSRRQAVHVSNISEATSGGSGAGSSDAEAAPDWSRNSGQALRVNLPQREVTSTGSPLPSVLPTSAPTLERGESTVSAPVARPPISWNSPMLFPSVTRSPLASSTATDSLSTGFMGLTGQMQHMNIGSARQPASTPPASGFVGFFDGLSGYSNNNNSNSNNNNNANNNSGGLSLHHHQFSSPSNLGGTSSTSASTGGPSQLASAVCRRLASAAAASAATSSTSPQHATLFPSALYGTAGSGSLANYFSTAATTGNSSSSSPGGIRSSGDRVQNAPPGASIASSGIGGSLASGSRGAPPLPPRLTPSPLSGGLLGSSYTASGRLAAGGGAGSGIASAGGRMGGSSSSPGPLVSAASSQLSSKTLGEKGETSSDEEESGKIGECVICMNNKSNSVVYTCGHLCMCYDCAVTQWAKHGFCPMCRSEIKDVIKFFKSC